VSQADKPSAFEVAYRFLSSRERTVGEVRRKLERASIPAGEAEEAITELLEMGYLDDARYARLFAEDKRSLEGWGSERIVRTLVERGIDRELAREAAGEDEGSGGEIERAVALLARRFPVGAVDRRERERALGVLLRKGYESEIAVDAVNRWSRAA
jgi:regulatory protein